MKALGDSDEFVEGKEDYLLRLNSTDRDGTSDKSRMISIHIDIKTGKMSFRIIPNPAFIGQTLDLQLDGVEKREIKSIEIYNIIGKKVSSFNNLDAVNTHGLKSGNYLIRVITKNGKTIVKKLQI